MSLKPINPRESAADACADALRTAILRAEFPAGSRLPPERSLAETFGVNRVTVRSALAKLEAAHLVSVRQGSGYLVRDYQREGGPELISSLVGLAHGPHAFAVIARDLLLVRRQLAAAVLERIVERGALSRAALSRFQRAIDDLEAAAVTGDVVEIADRDLALAGMLIAASGSPVLALTMNPIARIVHELPPLRAAIYREPLRNVTSYRALSAWLAAPSTQGANAIVAMLAEHDERTLAVLENPRREGKKKERRSQP